MKTTFDRVEIGTNPETQVGDLACKYKFNWDDATEGLVSKEILLGWCGGPQDFIDSPGSQIRLSHLFRDLGLWTRTLGLVKN